MRGKIPKEICGLTELERLVINSSYFYSPNEIPKEIANCTNLSSFRVYNNQITGDISARLGLMERLTLLDLSKNELSPNIPSSLKSHSNFERFKF